MAAKIPCWQCGKALTQKPDGTLVYKTVTIPGGNEVKVHIICAQSAVQFQRFDTTPVRVIDRRADE